MTTVHKFPLAAIPDVELMMPAGARLLHVGHQDGALMLWAEVDEQAPAERRQFVVVGTGWGKPADAEVYVGTVQAPNGLVWHVFEVAPLPVPEVGEERQAMIDQLQDQAIELDMLREALGVPYEPHQSLLERMLERAKSLRSEAERACTHLLMCHRFYQRIAPPMCDGVDAEGSPSQSRELREFVSMLERRADAAMLREVAR